MDSRNELSTALKRDAGNLLTKDLNEILVQPIARSTDFYNTDSFNTLLIIVPKRDI
jgi:hypothetical protein